MASKIVHLVSLSLSKELKESNNRTVSNKIDNGKLPLIWLAKKDNLMLLNQLNPLSINTNAKHVNGMTH